MYISRQKSLDQFNIGFIAIRDEVDLHILVFTSAVYFLKNFSLFLFRN